MNLYIAGPMRGIEQFNFPAFDAAEEDLTERGFGVINPARHDREVYPDIEEWEGFKTGSLEDCPDFDFAAAMRWDLYALMACDGIVLLPGWQNSSGACLERSVANATGKQVWEYETMVRADMRYTADPVRDVTTDEVRVVNRETGGAKGQKLARFDLLPSGPLRQVAEHYGIGARKYEDRNWERGYNWSLSFGAMQRHAWAFWQGEDADPETGSAHLAAVVFHALALMQFAATHPELDDRP